jgi:hypothetical protein
VNVIHCCPEGTPENVFRQLARIDDEVRLLRQGGWIAVYGPYLADDGSYKSQGDEEVSYLTASDRPWLTSSSIGITSKLKTRVWA